MSKKIISIVLAAMYLVFAGASDVLGGLCECHLEKMGWAKAKNHIYPGIKDLESCKAYCKTRPGGSFVDFYGTQGQSQEQIKKEAEEIKELYTPQGYTSEKHFEDAIAGLVQEIDKLIEQPASPESINQAAALHDLLFTVTEMYQGSKKTNRAILSSSQNRLQEIANYISKSTGTPSLTAEQIKELEERAKKELDELLSQQGYESQKKFEADLEALFKEIEGLLGQTPSAEAAQKAIELHYLLAEALELYRASEKTSPAVIAEAEDRLDNLVDYITHIGSQAPVLTPEQLADLEAKAKKDLEDLLAQQAHESQKKFEAELTGLMKEIDEILRQAPSTEAAEQAIQLHDLLTESLDKYQASDKPNAALVTDGETLLGNLADFINASREASTVLPSR
jgi:hypothetical protein